MSALSRSTFEALTIYNALELSASTERFEPGRCHEEDHGFSADPTGTEDEVPLKDHVTLESFVQTKLGRKKIAQNNDTLGG